MGAPAMRNEVHICDHENGHELSVDCWCEPTWINWVKNRYGVNALVVEHNDDRPSDVHRQVVLALRERDKHQVLPVEEGYVDAPWITRMLDEIPPFKVLPPEETR